MTTTTAAPTTVTAGRTRDLRIDAVRGLAILLMILDHLLVQAAPGHWLRYTLTRASLPLFALVAGYLWRPGWRSRYLIVFAASIPATIAGRLVGIAQPDVLVVILCAFLIVWAAHHLDLSPAWTVVLSVVLLATAETGWQWTRAGYDPRWVAGLMLLGRVVDVPSLGGVFAAYDHERGRWLAEWKWQTATADLLTTVGRFPLTFYVGHLVILAGVAWFLGFPAVST